MTRGTQETRFERAEKRRAAAAVAKAELAAEKAAAAKATALIAAAQKTAIKVRDYKEVVQVLDARRRQLGMRMEDVDHTSGLQGGYAAKLICGLRSLGPISLPLMLETLGLELLISLDRLGLELLISEKRPPALLRSPRRRCSRSQPTAKQPAWPYPPRMKDYRHEANETAYRQGRQPLPPGAHHVPGSAAYRALQGASHPGEVQVGKSFVADPRGGAPLVIGKKHIRVEGDKPRDPR
jgi:hypothetical protein